MLSDAMEPDTTSAIRDFFTACNPAHREFYSALMHDWREAGLPLSAGDGCVRLQARSVARSTEEGRPTLYELRAEQGREGARIEMDVGRWQRWLGEEETDACVQALAGIEGMSARRQGVKLWIIEPGHASGPTQQALRTALVRLGRRAAELIGA